MSRSAHPKLLRAYGRLLQSRRKAADLTQEEVLNNALKLGLKVPNRATISSLENGGEEPGLAMIIRVSCAVGIRPSEMMRQLEEIVLSPSELQRLDRGRDVKTDSPRHTYKPKRRSKTPQTK